MSNNNVDNNKNNSIQNNNYLTWLLVYIGIGFAISFTIPFPISLGVLLLVFILLNIYRTDIALKKQGRGGIKGMYKSMLSRASQSSGLGATGFGYNSIKFYCMNCGYEHKNDACPKCGSKTVKVG
ncbi:MAG: hypothetical protein ABJB73_09980 [Candidatus Nitrosocosmicus sp.]